MPATDSNQPFELILASSSPYRAQLLRNLQLNFKQISPNIDESQKRKETPDDLVKRLAQNKAKAVAKQLDELNPRLKTIVIASDQVAVLQSDNSILTKPGDFQQAFTQLKQQSGQMVNFLTSLCLYALEPSSKQPRFYTIIEPFWVQFRQLTDNEIENYLRLEQPFDCAGSFKSERLGLCLVEKMTGNDPNSLIGLPMIQLVKGLKQMGVNLI